MIESMNASYLKSDETDSTGSAALARLSHIEESDSKPATRLKVAYLMSWFPKITETFILREMIEMEKEGIDVEVFPLRKGNTSLMHDHAGRYVEKAHYTSFISIAILLANLATFCRMPIRYLSTLWILFRANFGSLRYFAGAFLFFPKAVFIAARCKKLEIDHIHAHFASHPAAVAYIVHRFSGITYSYTAHGSDLHRDQHMLREKTESSSGVVAISDYNRKMILDICGQKNSGKVRVIHCGIDSDRFPARKVPTSFEKRESEFSIVCIGTLHEVKGQTFLIEACRRLKARGISFRCRFLGDGPDQQNLQDQAQSFGVKNEVEFLGRCDELEVRTQLSDADVLVCPSVFSQDGRREGIPVVLMEAMSSGVPVIASEISGIPELVCDGESGLLTPPGDSLQIAESVERLFKDESLRKRLSRSAINKVRTEFDLSSNTRVLASFFSEMATGPIQ